MDVERLWRQLAQDGECRPLITLGEARAAVILLQQLEAQGGDAGDAAGDLVERIARRLPAEG